MVPSGTRIIDSPTDALICNKGFNLYLLATKLYNTHKLTHEKENQWQNMAREVQAENNC
jgi:predicted nuclease of restriction endonuclease-like RecB superfamily